MGSYTYAEKKDVLIELERLIGEPTILKELILKTRYLIPFSSHETPQSIVFEAIKRVEQGSRKWPIEVDFNKFLFHVVISLVSEQRRKIKAANKKEQNFDQKIIEDLLWEEFWVENLTPEEVLIDKEKQTKVQQILDKLFDDFSTDQTVMAILIGIEDSLKAREIKEMFSLTDTEYDSAKKRLKRYIDENYPNGLLI